ncbi:P-II family nitrogen regulator [Iocasia frigidifontis]|uniref:P-II family nitrogen regulator n=1 Tax=Iocasia fonsfrigidae TaxID=2682810 RepID=A0A8A7KAJ8_9FIRM|nr:P-II family nitrogen regulator [Iocasia fonsfrigidae]QTL97115.1 P-II family nitrogen regulator [Iocasia fonsfrigidae]
MKEIMAVIRMGMINKTKKALSLAGFDAITCIKANGRGKKKVNYELIEKLLGGKEVESKEISESISEGHRLIPKRVLLIVVNDEDMQKVVDTIIDVNKTGHPGDGKIFVIPVKDTIRVRTGETSKEAV